MGGLDLRGRERTGDCDVDTVAALAIGRLTKVHAAVHGVGCTDGAGGAHGGARFDVGLGQFLLDLPAAGGVIEALAAQREGLISEEL